MEVVPNCEDSLNSTPKSPFFLKKQPLVRQARPPIGWHNIVWQLPQTTTFWEWLKTVVLQSNKTNIAQFNIQIHTKITNS